MKLKKRVVTLLTLSTMILLTACGKTSYTDKERTEFVDNCKKAASAQGAITAEKIQEYCECSWNKIVEKFPNKKDFEDMMQTRQHEMADVIKDCIAALVQP